MLTRPIIHTNDDLKPFIERKESKIMIIEGYYESGFVSYLFYFLPIPLFAIASMHSTDVYRTTLYIASAILFSLISVFIGYKVRRKVPAEYETLIEEIFKYQHFCLMCNQYLGKHPRGSEYLECDRCSSNRTTIIDPLKGRYEGKMEALPSYAVSLHNH